MAKIATIRDLFVGAALNAQWTVDGGIATVSGGAVHLASHDVTMPGAPYSRLKTTDSLDATDSSAYVQTTDLVGSFSFGPDSGTPFWEFYRDGADLVGDSDNGAYAETWRLAYNATDHRYLRLRHAISTLYWDTAPDAVTWTNQGSRSDGAADFTTGRLGLVSSAGVGDPEQAFLTVNTTKLAASASVAVFG